MLLGLGVCLAAILGALGSLLVPWSLSGHYFGSFGVTFGSFGVTFGALGASLGPPWGSLGGFWTLGISNGHGRVNGGGHVTRNNEKGGICKMGVEMVAPGRISGGGRCNSHPVWARVKSWTCLAPILVI